MFDISDVVSQITDRDVVQVVLDSSKQKYVCGLPTLPSNESAFFKRNVDSAAQVAAKTNSVEMLDRCVRDSRHKVRKAALTNPNITHAQILTMGEYAVRRGSSQESVLAKLFENHLSASEVTKLVQSPKVNTRALEGGPYRAVVSHVANLPEQDRCAWVEALHRSNPEVSSEFLRYAADHEEGVLFSLSSVRRLAPLSGVELLLHRLYKEGDADLTDDELRAACGKYGFDIDRHHVLRVGPDVLARYLKLGADPMSYTKILDSSVTPDSTARVLIRALSPRTIRGAYVPRSLHLEKCKWSAETLRRYIECPPEDSYSRAALLQQALQVPEESQQEVVEQLITEWCQHASGYTRWAFLNEFLEGTAQVKPGLTYIELTQDPAAAGTALQRHDPLEVAAALGAASTNSGKLVGAVFSEVFGDNCEAWRLGMQMVTTAGAEEDLLSITETVCALVDLPFEA